MEQDVDQIDEISNATQDTDLVESLQRVARLTRQYVQFAVSEAGLHVGQDEFIDVLSIDTSHTVAIVARQLGVRPSTLVKMTDRLVSKGLIKRLKVSSDRRKTAIILTPEGAEVQRLVRDIWSRVERELFGELPASEIHTIRENLTMLDKRIKKRLHRLR